MYVLRTYCIEKGFKKRKLRNLKSSHYANLNSQVENAEKSGWTNFHKEKFWMPHLKKFPSLIFWSLKLLFHCLLLHTHHRRQKYACMAPRVKFQCLTRIFQHGNNKISSRNAERSYVLFRRSRRFDEVDKPDKSKAQVTHRTNANYAVCIVYISLNSSAVLGGNLTTVTVWHGLNELFRQRWTEEEGRIINFCDEKRHRDVAWSRLANKQMNAFRLIIYFEPFLSSSHENH